MPSTSILVACIGNIFLGDDGFGSEVALALAHANLPAQVQVVDYGIRGLDLTYALLEPWAAVVLVDTASRGEPAGTLYLLQPASGDASDPVPGALAGPQALDPHALDPAAVISAARSLGEVSAELYIVACEPLDFGDELEGRMGLSAPVQAAVAEAVAMVTELTMRLSAGAEHAFAPG